MYSSQIFPLQCAGLITFSQTAQKGFSVCKAEEKGNTAASLTAGTRQMKMHAYAPSLYPQQKRNHNHSFSSFDRIILCYKYLLVNSPSPGSFVP